MEEGHLRKKRETRGTLNVLFVSQLLRGINVGPEVESIGPFMQEQEDAKEVSPHPSFPPVGHDKISGFVNLKGGMIAFALCVRLKEPSPCWNILLTLNCAQSAKNSFLCDQDSTGKSKQFWKATLSVFDIFPFGRGRHFRVSLLANSSLWSIRLRCPYSPFKSGSNKRSLHRRPRDRET